MTERKTPSDPVRLEIEILNDTIDAENDLPDSEEPQKEPDSAPSAAPKEIKPG